MYINRIGRWKIGQSGEVVDLASCGEEKKKKKMSPYSGLRFPQPYPAVKIGLKIWGYEHVYFLYSFGV